MIMEVGAGEPPILRDHGTNTNGIRSMSGTPSLPGDHPTSGHDDDRWRVGGLSPAGIAGRPGMRCHAREPGTGHSLLSGVSAESASDAWAVGCRCSESGKNPPEHTLVLHWNGTSWMRS